MRRFNLFTWESGDVSHVDSPLAEYQSWDAKVLEGLTRP